MRCPRITCLFIGTLLAAQAADGLTPSAKVRQPVAYPQAAASFVDVAYLPPERDTLTWTDQGLAHRARMNVHVPPGEGPFPALIMVHGGGWLIGSKDPGPMTYDRKDPQRQTVAVGLARGYVMISCNYLLGVGTHPQVQRDTRELIRHLRANAERYRIDPNRIGAYGSSAGGWLISSTFFTTAADLEGAGYLFTIGDAEGNARVRRQLEGRLGREGRPLVIPVGLDEPSPTHPEVSARLGAIAFDFYLEGQAYSGDDPRVCTFKGVDAPQAEFVARTPADLPAGMIDVVALGQKRFRNAAKVHGPDFHQVVASRDGDSEVTLHERVFEFFDAELRGPAARTPPAELRPNRRIFADSIEVSFATAGPDTSVYFTTDASAPSRQSPRYTSPFTVGETTTVRWLAVAEGMQPSGVCTAVLQRGAPPPVITGPDALPTGRVGEPLSVTFTAPQAGLWDIAVQNRGLPKEDQKDHAKQATYKASGGASRSRATLRASSNRARRPLTNWSGKSGPLPSPTPRARRSLSSTTSKCRGRGRRRRPTSSRASIFTANSAHRSASRACANW